MTFVVTTLVKKRKPKPFVLTTKNYFDSCRPHISNSQVSDFLKSRRYYYDKHIAKTIETKLTANMKVGRITDAIVTKQKHNLQVRVLKRDDPERYERQKEMSEDCLVSEDQMATGKALAKAVMREPFFAEYDFKEKTKTQVLLTGLVDEMLICGLVDLFTYKDGVFAIDDLKTATAFAAQDAKHWFHHCLEFGYLRQLAAYRMMLRETWPQIVDRGVTPAMEKNFKIICRHIVAYKAGDSLYKVKLFTFNPATLDLAEREFVAGVRGIKQCLTTGRWDDPPVTWQDAEEIVNPTGEEMWEGDDVEDKETDDSVFYLEEVERKPA